LRIEFEKLWLSVLKFLEFLKCEFSKYRPLWLRKDIAEYAVGRG